jgi:hypothetical protein
VQPDLEWTVSKGRDRERCDWRGRPVSLGHRGISTFRGKLTADGNLATDPAGRHA